MFKICFHEWERTGKLQHSKYDIDGNEVLVAECTCKKCNKKKLKQFLGRRIGNLFE